MKKGGDGSYLSPGKLASLWGVDEAVFAAGVMRRTVKAGGTNASVALNAAQVKENLLLHLPANCFRFRIYLAYIVVPVFLFCFSFRPFSPFQNVYVCLFLNVCTFVRLFPPLLFTCSFNVQSSHT